MVREITFVMLAVVGLLLLQFTDCASAFAHDRQSMQCCGSMPCDPSNHSHECCKTMVSSQYPRALPAAHVTLQPPATVAANILPMPQVPALAELSRSEFAAPQHSPPGLYTLHSSFLI